MVKRLTTILLIAQGVHLQMQLETLEECYGSRIHFFQSKRNLSSFSRTQGLAWLESELLELLSAPVNHELSSKILL